MLKLGPTCVFVLALGLVVVPATAAQKTQTGEHAKMGTATTTTTPTTPGGKLPTGQFTGVMELNASDCRLDGGEVITPGDSRCGKLNAPYCRKANGEAACLTE